MHEAATHDRNSFITLTYAPEHLPPDMSLDVSHWQRFAKRLRKKHSFRFYHCGEYGETNGRPHYHACLFGIDFSKDRVFHSTTRNGDRLYVSPTLTQTWGLGHAVIGDLTFESAAYVSRYVTKKVVGKDAPEFYGGRKPEYATMSRRPGIGADWFARWGDQVYPRDEVIMRGRRMKPPKYYDQLLAAKDADGAETVRRSRLKAASTNRFDKTPERLQVREQVQTLNQKTFKRDTEKT